jgi:ubiquinone/menaquinone biosynthesis C-methylase UbiE
MQNSPWHTKVAKNEEPKSMTNVLLQKSITALKEGNLLEKSVNYIIRFIKRKLQTKIKVIKKKFFTFNGNWYHGETAEIYESKRVKQDWWHDEIKGLSKLLKLIPQGVSVLDVPFGTGRFLPLYYEKQMTVTGLDISHDMLYEAKKLRGDLLEKCIVDIGDARTLPYENNSFDLIVSIRFVDGHLAFKDAKKVISEFCRVSRKYLIVELATVPEGDESQFRIQNLQEKQPISGRLSESERIRFFKGFGLKMVAEETAYKEEKSYVIIYLCEKINS